MRVRLAGVSSGRTYSRCFTRKTALLVIGHWKEEEEEKVRANQFFSGSEITRAEKMGNRLSSCGPLIRKAYRNEDTPWQNLRKRDGHLLR